MFNSRIPSPGTSNLLACNSQASSPCRRSRANQEDDGGNLTVVTNERCHKINKSNSIEYE